jgi:hypothetical protein
MCTSDSCKITRRFPAYATNSADSTGMPRTANPLASSRPSIRSGSGSRLPSEGVTTTVPLTSPSIRSPIFSS